jgi:hypothetical protein
MAGSPRGSVLRKAVRQAVLATDASLLHRLSPVVPELRSLPARQGYLPLSVFVAGMSASERRRFRDKDWSSGDRLPSHLDRAAIPGLAKVGVAGRSSWRLCAKSMKARVR